MKRRPLVAAACALATGACSTFGSADEPTTAGDAGSGAADAASPPDPAGPVPGIDAGVCPTTVPPPASGPTCSSAPSGRCNGSETCCSGPPGFSFCMASFDGACPTTYPRWRCESDANCTAPAICCADLAVIPGASCRTYRAAESIGSRCTDRVDCANATDNARFRLCTDDFDCAREGALRCQPSYVVVGTSTTPVHVGVCAAP